MAVSFQSQPPLMVSTEPRPREDSLELSTHLKLSHVWWGSLAQGGTAGREDRDPRVSPRVEGGMPAFYPHPLLSSGRALHTDITAQLEVSCFTSCPCFPPSPCSGPRSPGTPASRGFCSP